ncbi:protein archease isoform X2 [Cloeon dipterum]|uniref:protein archease isoform X2 n=1 Tax=Cloeon dipterum TaxID=197152 RepID=UPI00321FEECE
MIFPGSNTSIWTTQQMSSCTRGATLWRSASNSAPWPCSTTFPSWTSVMQILEMRRVSVEGHDMLSLLYNFLDECLFMFNCEPFFLAKKVKIIEFDRTAWKIRAELYGEEFDLEKHPQGTEVKAITYSNMQVHEDKPQKEVFVIIDI